MDKSILSDLVLYLNHPRTRDNLCKVIQFGSRFVSGGNEGLAEQVSSSVAVSRKVFCLLKSVDELESLISRHIEDDPLSLVLLSKLKNSLMAAYFALDHFVWTGRTGIYKNKKIIDSVACISMYLSLGGSACDLFIECFQVVWPNKGKKLESTGSKSEDKDNKYDREKTILNRIQDRKLRLLMSSMDIVLGIGLLQLAPKRVTPRITGAVGTITSIISCYELFKSAIPKNEVDI
ncbi:hypothetical protein KP509_03G050300 [Ceratopteris richardii]|uniref:Uncharacterized protein n=1 Tax=Ceratopteris richardii TaxID=49495 RepID=A0A8T2V3E4_CERRI|nr:hypothetical protein KP509_03G050300 [Ceratopteris richardii]KAH7441711.1 hypothetical protein KP509_03G050300 [Ceratopteris richardii]